MDDRRIGHFECIEERGRGTFATVWEAQDTKLDRRVALKLLRSCGESPDDVARFVSEARVAASLAHENIVRIFETGVAEGTYFIAYELIDGVSLREWAAFVEPSSDEVGRMLTKIADALSYAHEHGVVHRDLKPENLLVDISGKPYITDFGLAQITSTRVTRDNVAIGTVAYMSPEQAAGDGRSLDGRSDIFSLGVVLFELLTRQLPFRGVSCAEYLAQLRWFDAPSVLDLNRNVPRDLAAICDKCLTSEPRYRYSTARELAVDLRRFLAAKPVAARPLGVVRRAWRMVRRYPTQSGLLAALAVVIVAAAMVSAYLAGTMRLAQRDSEVKRALAVQSLVTALLDAPSDKVSEAIARLQPLAADVRSQLETASADSRLNPRSRLHALLALAHLEEPDSDHVRRILELVPLVPDDELSGVLLAGLRNNYAETAKQVLRMLSDTSGQTLGRFCLLALLFGHPDSASTLAALDEDQSGRHELINVAAGWGAGMLDLLRMARDTGDAHLLSAVLTGMAEADQSRLTSNEKELLASEFVDAYRQSDAGIHSAAVYALSRWNLDMPASPVGEDSDWYQHPLGMTFVRILPGKLDIKDSGAARNLRIQRPFFMSSTEVPLELCRRLFGDSEDTESQEVVRGLRVLSVDASANHITPRIARRLCNLFSEAEGLPAVYVDSSNSQDELVFDKGSGGYRLPTCEEWEWAARSLSTTLYFFGQFPFGLERYAVCRDVSGDNLAVYPAGRRRPNGFGLFDVYGNVAELTTLDDKVFFSGGSNWHSPSDCTSVTRDVFVSPSVMIGLRLVRNDQ